LARAAWGTPDASREVELEAELEAVGDVEIEVEVVSDGVWAEVD
jgi:hypothetical protein